MNECGVSDPLVDRSGRAGPRENAEAGARVAITPGGSLDLEFRKLGDDGVNAYDVFESRGSYSRRAD